MARSRHLRKCGTGRTQLPKVAMLRLIVSALVSIALVAGTASAQMAPHHPAPGMTMHAGSSPMPMSGCMHGAPAHKGVPCPMLSCFPSVPVFLLPSQIGAPFPVPSAVAARPRLRDAALRGTLAETDPPVPRLPSC